MRRAPLASSLCAVVVLACGDDAVPTGPLDVQGAAYRGVLLPANAWPSYGYEVEGFWPATPTDVERAEAALPAAAKRFAPELTEPLDRYVRQYIGIVQDGRRLLYVNLLHEASIRPTPDDDAEEPGAWRRELVVVDDGGDWYVEAFYDVETGQFSALWVHGEA